VDGLHLQHDKGEVVGRNRLSTYQEDREDGGKDGYRRRQGGDRILGRHHGGGRSIDTQRDRRGVIKVLNVNDNWGY
jgi:hypothetical protein